MMLKTMIALSVLLLFISLAGCKDVKPPAENSSAPTANETNQTAETTIEVDMPETVIPEPGTESFPEPGTPANASTKPGQLKAVQIQGMNRDAAAKLQKDLNLQPRVGVPSFVTPHINDAGKCESLTLMGFKITDDVMQKISEMDSLTTHLGLDQCEVTDAQISQLADMKTLKSLESIHLTSAPLTGSSLDVLKGCEKLEYLDLSGCTNLTIDKLPPLPALKTLVLIDCKKVTDETISKLATMTNLKTLKLYDTKITPAGIAKLKELLPNCEISY